MNVLPVIALIALSQVDAVSTASPKVTLDADASADVLVANSVNTDPGGGPEPELTSVELGISARLHATAASRHLHLDVDYQGRQPIAGNAPNTAIHLLYQAELSADFLNTLFFVGLGRFLAPSAVMLPVDGLRAQVHVGPVTVQGFAGRRAITSTRGNVDFGRFLPAGGGSVALGFARLTAELAVTFSRDEVPLLEGQAPKSFDALSAYLRAMGRPFDWLVLGGEVATAQRASYVLGPTWDDLTLTTRTVDLFYAIAFVELRPAKSLRIAYDFHFQQADLFRQGTVDDTGTPANVAFTPQFIDNRIRVKWSPFGLGWLGPEVRARVRPDWHEWRVGGFADLAPAWAKGFGLRGSYTFEKMVQTGALTPPSDRSYWSASVGWRWRGLDLALGASDVQRSNLPLSGRVYTPYDDSSPKAPVDLSPFVLAAQRIAFLRAFYGNEIFFAGVDFEQSLTDPRERRVYAQLGARLEEVW